MRGDYIARREYDKRQRQQMEDMASLSRSIVELKGMIAETRAFIDHIAKLTDQRFDAAQEALKLALSNMDKRLDQMNEFRAQLKDQSATFVTRALVDAMIAGVETDIATVHTMMAAIQNVQAASGGSKETSANWLATLIAIGSLIATILLVVFR